MHIGLIGYLSGSTRVLTRELAQRLSNNGHKVSVIAIGGEVYQGLYGNSQIYSVLRDEDEGSMFMGVSSLRCLLRRMCPSIFRDASEQRNEYLEYIAWNMFRFFSSMPSLLRILRELNPDVLHGHGEIAMGYFTSLCGGLLHKPSIVTVTRIESRYPFLSLPCAEGQHDAVVVRTLKSRLLLKLGGVVCFNRYVKSALIRSGLQSNKVFIVPYGVREEFRTAYEEGARADLKIDDRDKIVLFWGGGIHRSGCDIFLRAVKIILNRVPNARFLVVVRDFTEEVEMIVQRTVKETSRVTVLNRMEKEYPWPITSIVASADVVVLPYMVNPMEPPLVLVESMFLGKPVITTPIGGNGELIKHMETGLLVPPDPKYLAEAVSYLLENDEKREMTGRKGQRMVMKTYDWGRCLRSIETIYQNISKHYSSK